MPKYRVTTDDGKTYEVTTEDSPSPSTPSSPSKPLAMSRRGGEALGGHPPGLPTDGITPMLATPFTSGGNQVLKGAQSFLDPQAGLDQKIGAATNMAEGAATFLSPAILPAGLARGAAAYGIKNLVPKALAGAAVGGGTTAILRGTLPALGVPPGTTQALSDLGGVAAGGMAFNRTPKLAAPTIQDHPEAELMRAFPGMSNKANTDAPETIARGMDELRRTAPEIFKGKDFRMGWEGKKQGDFTQLLYDKVGQARERVWGDWQKMSAPFRKILQLDGNQMVQGVEDLTAPNAIRGDRSPYAENLIAQFKGRQVPMDEAEKVLREINTFNAALHKKSMGQQALLTRQDVADKGALETLARNIRSQLYQGVDRLQGGKQAAELMRRYGALAELGEEFEGLLNPARMGAGLDDVARAKAAGQALSEYMVGLRGSAIHTLRSAVMHPETVDQQLMKALGNYKGQAPVVELTPQPVPRALLSAPTGPVGVSGVTMPDMAGKVRTQAFQMTRALPPASQGPMLGPQGGPPLVTPSPQPNPATTDPRLATFGFAGQTNTRINPQPPPGGWPSRVNAPNPGERTFSPEVISEFALRNGITYVEALKRLHGP